MSAPPTLEEQVFCVRRELRLRRRAYPRWVQTGKMTRAEADKQIAHMEAALATLEGLLPKPLAGLFD